MSGTLRPGMKLALERFEAEANGEGYLLPARLRLVDKEEMRSVEIVSIGGAWFAAHMPEGGGGDGD